MNHSIHMKSHLKAIWNHIHIIDQSTMSHIHLKYSHIQSCERIPTSNPCWWGINTYSHIQSCERIYTYIWYIWSILKTLILSHISQSKVYTKYNNLLDIKNFFSNTEAYQRSQYRIEHKSKDTWLSWGTNRDWGVYVNILQFLNKSEN